MTPRSFAGNPSRTRQLQVDPRQVGVKSGAPDDVGDVEDRPVLEDGAALAHGDHPGHPHDPGSCDVPPAHPAKRNAAGRVQEMVTHLPADRCPDRKHVRRHEPHHGQQEPVGKAAGAGGLLTGVAPREPSLVVPRELDGDLGPGVPGAHHKNPARLELGRIAVLAGVQLNDVGVEIGTQSRHSRGAIGAGGHDHVVRIEAVLARHRLQDVAAASKPFDLDAGPNRQLEPRRIGLQVVGGLVLGRVVRPRSRERHARESAVRGRREQSKRVPPAPPGPTNPLVFVDDQERSTMLGQVVAGGKT